MGGIGAMASLNLNHLYKVYPNGKKAVNDFTMDIEDKEFIVFVGPSGCGKSTTLRMIAGLEEISAGELKIGGTVVNDVDPRHRDVAMVFQNYALYPHMTVYNNIAFPLKMAGMPKAKIKEKVTEAAQILGLTEYLNIKPGEMSGGQRQRVALGRALVREPKVMLLDEPLSNLDAKLRTQMRSEITKLHKRIQTTFIYVTHDQAEAMTMGDRIVVMCDGYIQQIDTPTNLYRYPVNKFVAGFIGTPPMNFFTVTLDKNEDNVTVNFPEGKSVMTDYALISRLSKEYFDGRKVTFGVRPEDISVSTGAENAIECAVVSTEILGSETLLYCDVNCQREHYDASETSFIIKASAGTSVKEGDILYVKPDFSRSLFFDIETDICVTPMVPAADSIKVTVCDGELRLGENSVELPVEIDLPDGEYIASFPTDAFLKGGKYSGTAAFAGSTKDGKSLIRMRSGEEEFWLVSDEEIDGETSFTPDYKKFTFAKDGEVVKKCLDTGNVLEGRFIKKKRKQKNQLGLKFDIVFTCGDTQFICPPSVVKRILSVSDRKYTGVDIQLRYSYADVTEGSALTAVPERILDYGNEKFALCDIQGRQAVLPAKGIKDGRISYDIDLEKVAFYEKEADIRLA